MSFAGFLDLNLIGQDRIGWSGRRTMKNWSEKSAEVERLSTRMDYLQTSNTRKVYYPEEEVS